MALVVGWIRCGAKQSGRVSGKDGLIVKRAYG